MTFSLYDRGPHYLACSSPVKKGGVPSFTVP